MSSIDPISMATQLATYDVQAFQQRYKTQSDRYQTQLTALGKVESALREFRTAVNEMNNSTSGIVKNSATLSQEGFFSSNANANALSGHYQVFIEQVASSHQLATDMPDDLQATSLIPATGTLDFTIDGKTMSVELASVDRDGDGQATMAELVTTINNHDDNPGVNATLVRSNGQTHFMLSSTKTGVTNSINVRASGTGQAWFEGAFLNTTEISAPQDAVIWLGAQNTGLKLTNASNQFEGVIDGVDITVTKAQSAGESPINLEVGPDNDGTKEQVDKFIETYNNLVSTLDEYGRIGGENKQRGALANDPTLRSIQSQLTAITRNEFNGMRLSDVGITSSRDGKLSVNNERFKEAQKNNSAGIEAMFNGKDALLDRLDNMAEPFLKFSSGLFSSRKEALRSSMDRIADKQTTLERKYDTSYKRYLKQFTQMNTLMTQMNQTMSMFGQTH
ncbi:flagellar filament capping protein FliD [Vibrio sp.]|uniref:flagellar filament capping protein FliD n=1 Tax=Vibrio sp. TaxID=678 RepID=UPI003D15197E